jgi:hypothetical protein
MQTRAFRLEMARCKPTAFVPSVFAPECGDPACSTDHKYRPNRTRRILALVSSTSFVSVHRAADAVLACCVDQMMAAMLLAPSKQHRGDAQCHSERLFPERRATPAARTGPHSARKVARRCPRSACASFRVNAAKIQHRRPRGPWSDTHEHSTYLTEGRSEGSYVFPLCVFSVYGTVHAGGSA